MADPFQSNPSRYTPHSTQAAPPYAAGIPDSADRIDCNFDDSTPWDSPLDRLPVDKPVTYTASIGQNPFAQKRRPQDPVQAKKQKKRSALLIIYSSVIALCFLIVMAIAVMVTPQIAGIFWKDLDNYAFINGELLRYNSDAVLAYNQYKDYLARDVIYPGVFVDGIYVGGLTPEEALAALGDENAASAAFSITISIGDKVWTLDKTNVSAHRDINGALVKAYSYGRQNTAGIASTQKTPFRERTDTVIALRSSYADVHSKQAYDYASIQSVIDTIVSYVTRDPVDSEIVRFDFNTRAFTFSDDQPGVTIDGAALYDQVIGLLQQGITRQSITVSPTLTLPTVTKETLENTFKLVSAFTTKTSSDSDRNNNISIACQAINGTVLLPDQTFSFNGTVGERTTSRGYREAGAIAGGELIDEVGGGICQVSSTLFNAVARANLEVVSRSPHAWPSTYVNKGEDATVNWPNLDFKFKNNTDTPIFIITYYKDRQCTAEIWGKTLGDNVSIDLSSTTTKTIEPSTAIIYTQNPALPFGTSKETVKMRVGYVVDTYKVWYQNGTEFKRELLHTSTYRAYQKTIEYN